MNAETKKTIERGTWKQIARLWDANRPNSAVRRAILRECRLCGYTPAVILGIHR